MSLWPFSHPRLSRPETPAEHARALSQAGHAQRRARALAVADQMRADTASGRITKLQPRGGE